jgi:hypothetical protein
MRSKLAMLLELGVVAAIAAMLSGCFGDGATPSYDGVWTAAVADSNTVTISGVTATCTVPTIPTVTLTNGVGSFSQTDSCVYTVSSVSYTQPLIYLVSVAVTTSTGAVQAIVNGTTISGQCISSIGCAAQGSGYSLSLTR